MITQQFKAIYFKFFFFISIFITFGLFFTSLTLAQEPQEELEIQKKHEFTVPQEDFQHRWIFSAGVGHPFIRTGSLLRLGEKRVGQLLALSYFFGSLHGITLGLGLDNYGPGGNLSTETTSVSSGGPKGLGAINPFLAYSVQNYMYEKMSLFYDIGVGIYRFTGLREESANKNLFSLTQHFGLSHDLPEKFQHISGAKMKVGPSLAHTWIPESQLKNLNIKGHTLSFNLHIRFVF